MPGDRNQIVGMPKAWRAKHQGHLACHHLNRREVRLWSGVKAPHSNAVAMQTAFHLVLIRTCVADIASKAGQKRDSGEIFRGRKKGQLSMFIVDAQGKGRPRITSGFTGKKCGFGMRWLDAAFLRLWDSPWWFECGVKRLYAKATKRLIPGRWLDFLAILG